MDLKDYRQARCPHGWVDVTQCEPCKTAAERDALRNEVDRLREFAKLVNEAPVFFAPNHDFDGKKLAWLKRAGLAA